MSTEGPSFEIDERLRIPWRELRFTFARSSGAGGQNVNKVNSKAVLHWLARANTSLPAAVLDRFLTQFSSRLGEDGELVLASDVHRDQIRNRNECLARLAAMLRSVARPPKPRIKTKPTKSSQRRRVTEKRHLGEKKAQRRRPGDDE